MAEATDRDRHRRSRPGDEGLARLARALNTRTPRVLRRLGGGLGSATHLIAFEDRRVVLKRYPVGADTPALEWQCLTFARGAHLPAPEPLALDQEGAWFGCPSLAIELIPGHPDLSPANVDRYVDEVADALAEIHSAPTSDAEGAMLRPHAVDSWATPDEVPDGLIKSGVASQVVDAITERIRRADRGETVVSHGDFHPGNLLWSRNRLTGVIDWSHARLGPRWWELAYFRMELAVLASTRAADSFLNRYESLVGKTSPDQPIWDLVCLYNGHRWGHMWLTGYREQGRRDLTPQTMSRRLTQLARRALAALER